MIFKKIINFNIDDISRVKHDLHTFIDKEENWQSPPCPNRKNFIPESCNPECKDAATSLSIDPVLYPTERNVIATVYGLNATRLLQAF